MSMFSLIFLYVRPSFYRDDHVWRFVVLALPNIRGRQSCTIILFHCTDTQHLAIISGVKAETRVKQIITCYRRQNALYGADASFSEKLICFCHFLMTISSGSKYRFNTHHRSRRLRRRWLFVLTQSSMSANHLRVVV